jgi:hypothetical protein
VVRRRLPAPFDLVERRLQRVDGVQSAVDQVALGLHVVGTDGVEEVLEGVCQVARAVVPLHPERALEAVGAPEQFVDRLAVRALRLQPNEPLAQSLDVVARLANERVGAHAGQGARFSPMTSAMASTTSSSPNGLVM